MVSTHATWKSYGANYWAGANYNLGWHQPRLLVCLNVQCLCLSVGVARLGQAKEIYAVLAMCVMRYNMYAKIYVKSYTNIECIYILDATSLA